MSSLLSEHPWVCQTPSAQGEASEQSSVLLRSLGCGLESCAERLSNFGSDPESFAPM